MDGPFAVVNADDYYGPEGFREIYDYLSANPDRPGCYEFAMVGYRLGNTVTENGSVARGICEEDEHNFLVRVTERTRIEAEGADARFTEDGGETWTHLSGDTVVSMNLWGFTRSFMDEARARFPAFLRSADKWYGVTYREDRPVVLKAIADMTASGLYPDNLWEV